MKCSEVREFLSEIHFQREPVNPIPPPDLAYLQAGGYVQTTTKEDHDGGAADVDRLNQLAYEVAAEKPVQEQASEALSQDQQKEHSFLFHFQGKDEKDALRLKVEEETTVTSSETAKLTSIEANLNALLQEKSAVDQMVAYGGGYLSLTGPGSIVLNDLSVRDYRVADEEFPDFVEETKATYAEFRTISDRASSYVALLQPRVPQIEDAFTQADRTQSVLWSTAIGLGKLQGDPVQTGERVIEALAVLQGFKSTTPNKLMAAEVMTALSGQDVQSLGPVLKDLDHKLTGGGVPGALGRDRRRDNGGAAVRRDLPHRQTSRSLRG